MQEATAGTLRSRAWFDNPDNIDMTALYLERYLNFGLSLEELRSGKPIIGIAQTGSDLSPCNRHHLVLADRVREGIREAGGIALEFPVHPIQETGKRPTAGLDRNLAYLGLVETLYGYPLDGVVLTVGCDKTTPACLMAAATVNLPAIALSVGPMLNGWHKGERTGSGTIVWKARQLLATGEIDDEGFIKLVSSSAPSTGYCNTMGTATTMNSLAEALGMSLPGSAAIPAPYRDRQEVAYRTGKQIVEMVAADRKPSDILTLNAFHNAIVVNSAIGGSTNAPIHLSALARHVGVDLPLKDWETHGHAVPLLVNLQPAGEYLGEDYYHAGGVPAVVAQLMGQGLIREDALTVNGRTIGENCRAVAIEDERVIRPFDQPLVRDAGFIVLSGNLFDAAIMKTSVIGPEFRDRYLSDPADPDAFEGPAVVFDGPEDYHARIDDPATGITTQTLLFMRGAGPIGYPGAAEVVNMRPPAYLITEGVHALPCIGDGRQSGTSGSPSILNASPEAAAMGGLALLRSGDRVRIDLRQRTANVLLPAAELSARRAALEAEGGYRYPASQTPWQEIQRGIVGQMNTGAILEGAEKYQRIAQTMGCRATIIEPDATSMDIKRIERPDRDLLGEGPVWVPERGRLFWVDILAPAVRWLDPATGDYGSRAFDERIGWIIPRAGRRDFVVGLKSGFHLFDLDADIVTAIGDPEPDRPHNRLNDAKVDAAGRIWAGSKDDRDEARSGALYRLDADLTWSRHDDDYGVTNGPTFSIDGSTLYHTDSAARTIYAFDLASDGALSGKRVFLTFEKAWGHPDGMTTDAEGCLWVAHWGGGRISRFAPDATLLQSIALPAVNISSMTFAGPDLDRMFVTSSANGQSEPDAGALFALDPGVRGLPPRAFAG